MSIRRTIVIPAIVAFGIAGSTLAVTTITAAAAQASVHVPATATTAQPNLYYHA